MKKIGLVIAHQGFQQVEYNHTKEILESSNRAKVITISNQAGTASAKDGQTIVEIDLTLDQVDTTKLDGLFIIGGPQALDWLDNEKTSALLQQMEILKKPYGAICISVRILAKAGVLKNLKATGWNNDNKLEEIFKKYQVKYEDQPVVLDGIVVTASGPDAAVEFGREILCVLNILNCQLNS